MQNLSDIKINLCGYIIKLAVIVSNTNFENNFFLIIARTIVLYIKKV